MNVKELIKYVVIFFLFIKCTKVDNKVNEDVSNIIPIPPSNLVVKEVTESTIKISWVDKSTNEDGFKVERKVDPNPFSVIGMVQKDLSNFTDSGLNYNTRYTYRILSYNAKGISNTYSNEISETTLTPIAPIITTVEGSMITFYSVNLASKVTYSGQTAVGKRGFVYSKNPNPTIQNGVVLIIGSGLGSFSQKVVGLEESTKYYVRSFASNSIQTTYSPEFSFTTLPRPTLGIGGIGPGGGLIFYDRGSYVQDQTMGKSWRYLEVSGMPSTSAFGSVNVDFAWGCNSTGAIYSGIGEGFKNQLAILKSCPSPFRKSGIRDFYTWAIWVDSISQKGFSDWYIPSLYEVQLFYNSLIISGIMPVNGILASSTENNGDQFKIIIINGGPGPDNSFASTPKWAGASCQYFMIRAF